MGVAHAREEAEEQVVVVMAHAGREEKSERDGEAAGRDLAAVTARAELGEVVERGGEAGYRDRYRRRNRSRSLGSTAAAEHTDHHTLVRLCTHLSLCPSIHLQTLPLPVPTLQSPQSGSLKPPLLHPPYRQVSASVSASGTYPSLPRCLLWNPVDRWLRRKKKKWW
jgi:hypothetical protein